MTLSIPEPCSEDWNQMHVVDQQERHCTSCAKNVTDFTQMSDDELVLYFRHAQGKVCGRLRVDQLQRPMKAIPAATTVSGWWKAAMLLPFTLLAKTSSGQNDSIAVADTNVVVTNDSLVTDSVVHPIVEIQSETMDRNDSIPVEENTARKNQKEADNLEHVVVLQMGDVSGCVSPGWDAPLPGDWTLSAWFFSPFRKSRVHPVVEETIAALMTEHDPSKPPADPVPPTVPESPWYEAILPSTFRIRRNG